MNKTLKSKLTLPLLPSTIKRERLFSLLENLSSQKITTIVAGAGYGKTTLAVQVVESLGYRNIWYRLDRSDMDFFTYLSYLITGFKKHFPEFGEDTVSRIQQTKSLAIEWQSILMVFLNEVDHCIDGDFLVVFDDYHLVQGNPAINELTVFMLERLNPSVHLLIISRVEPEIPLSRYRATRELAEINENDLRFTNPEIKLIFKQLFDLSLEEKSLEILEEKTAGWASGLILFYHALKGKNATEVRQFLDHSQGTNRIIASYLEENIFSQQPENIKAFLQKSSFFPRLDVELCNEMLGIDDSADMLEYLATHHLFTFPVDENRAIYHYHHLFQDFLRKRFAQKSETEDYKAFHRETAERCRAQGLEEEALNHYLLADSYEECCAILNRIGKDLLKAGKFKQLESYLKSIPSPLIEEEPWLLYAQARVHELSGQPKAAIESYKNAHGKFSDLNIRKGAGLCLNALGNAYFQTGDFRRAEEKLEEVLISFAENDRVTLNILTHLIFISSHLGKMEQADKHFEKGIELAKKIDEKGLLESLYLNHGFRQGCASEFKKARDFARKAHDGFKDEKLQHLLAFNHHLMAWANHYLGEYELGYEDAQKGLRITRESGFLDASHAWLLMDVALNATPLKKENEAVEYAAKALEAFRSMENRWGQSYSLHVLQTAYMATGDFAKAEQMGKQSLKTIDGLNLPFEDGLFGSHLANLYLETGRPESALHLLERARNLVGRSALFLFQIDLWMAKYYFKTDQLELAEQRLKECLVTSELEKFDFCLLRESEWFYRLVSAIHKSGLMRSRIEQLLKKGGFDSSPVGDALVSLRPENLKISCLGEFRVFGGENELSVAQWSSQKAKLLLKYLIQRKAKGYTDKEQLIELLWPGSSSAKASHRLQVTLSTLRKILDSVNSQKGASDQYIKRDGNAYLLTLGENGWIDCDRFAIEIKAAKQNPEKMVEHLRKAEILYQGDYMRDDLYDDFFAAEREFYREEYLRVLQNLLNHFDAATAYDKCIEYAVKSLDTDPYNEAQYRALMKYYSFIGNRQKVKQTFQNCIKFLKSGLDVSPSEETSLVYQQLLQ